jgi:hypothetical protein
MQRITIILLSILLLVASGGFYDRPEAAAQSLEWKITAQQETFLDELQRDTFNFFWETTNPLNGLTPDRFPNSEFSSVAAVGFALTAYLVGAERQYISRSDAANRTLNTLQYLWEAPQGDSLDDVIGYKGFFYHFLDMESGLRHGRTELSTIDTALLTAGVLSAQTYFDEDDPAENQIRDYADRIYRRIEWPWAYSGRHKPLLSMGWRPRKGFTDGYWRGYNEAMILYILALGSPTYPIDAQSWNKWTSTYTWKEFHDYSHVNFGPLFGHQYSHVWVDFREIQDEYMRSRKIDYFINSKRATYANQAHCIKNPKGWMGYSDKVWGLTASNGPARITIMKNNDPISIHKYLARGAGTGYLRDDGTIAPTAVGGSVPFAPEITIPTLEHFKTQYGEKLYGKYGFKDAFNLSCRLEPSNPDGWFDNQYLGIDQGPILLMIENYRTEFIWNLMKKNPYIKKGLRQAGFSGGWLDKHPG